MAAMISVVLLQASAMRIRYFGGLSFTLVTLAVSSVSLIMLWMTAKEYTRASNVTFITTVESPELPGRWRNLTTNEVERMSQLGKMMYLEESIVESGNKSTLPELDKTFTILVWRFGKILENRHFRHFGKDTFDPFAMCSAHNCRVIYDESQLLGADAVLFHMQRMTPTILPAQRTNAQRWVALSDESTQTLPGRHAYDGVFNWTMTYSMFADVPVPYGRTVRLTESERRQMALLPFVDHAHKKSEVAAILGSNCGGVNHRWAFIEKMQQDVPIDVYGHCGPHKCPGHYDLDCPILSNYKFYLSFENSNCQEYITEKVWWQAFQHDAVPVIFGAPLQDCQRHLPPGSFIHADSFESPKRLARHLLELHLDNARYNAFFAWKADFKVANEHGYFQTPVFHYCRLCEALNYNAPTPKVYEDYAAARDPQQDCKPFASKWPLPK